MKIWGGHCAIGPTVFVVVVFCSIFLGFACLGPKLFSEITVFVLLFLWSFDKEAIPSSLCSRFFVTSFPRATSSNVIWADASDNLLIQWVSDKNFGDLSKHNFLLQEKWESCLINWVKPYRCSRIRWFPLREVNAGMKTVRPFRRCVPTHSADSSETKWPLTSGSAFHHVQWILTKPLQKTERFSNTLT